MAFVFLKFMATKNHGDWFWDCMRPLAQAIKDKNYDLIISAITSEIEKKPFSESESIITESIEIKLIRKATIEIVGYLAINPGYFEMDHLNMSDLIEIMDRCFPIHHKTIPQNTDDRTTWWANLPKLKQGRGDMHKNLKIWIKNWEERRRSGEIRFDPDGTMHMGSFTFHDAHQIVDAAQYMAYDIKGPLRDF